MLREWAGSGAQRELYLNHYALAGIGNLTAAFVSVQDHFHQIEAQAAAAGLAVPGGVCPVEGFEQVGEGLLRDADAGIFHCQQGLFPMEADGSAGADGDADLTAFR